MTAQSAGGFQTAEERYREIFAGASRRDALRCAIARAVRELRAVMEKEPNPAVTIAHMRNLDDLEPMTLALAYATAERTCVFWPSPGQIREMAGESPEERAIAALERVFFHFGRYGIDGRVANGAVRFGDDGTGRRVLLTTEPHRPAPELPPEIFRALTAIGSGSAKQGLMYLHQHPRIRGWEDAGGEVAAKTAERIERQWIRCYRQTLREQQQQVQTTSGGDR